MTKRLKLLYIPHPYLTNEGFTPWGQDIFKAIGNRHEIRTLDKKSPVKPQLDGIDVVVDLGGEAGSREGVSEERYQLALVLNISTWITGKVKGSLCPTHLVNLVPLVWQNVP